MNQIFNPRLLVPPMAIPTPHTTTAEVEYALAYLLEETRILSADDGTDGGITRPDYTPGPTLSDSIYAAEDGVYYLRVDDSWRVVVCGG